jgi:CBS domain-containing protein
MIKCDNCGADLAEGDRYCWNCANEVKAVKDVFTVSSDNLVAEVMKILHEGNVTKIIVKDEAGKILLEIPVWAGLVGVILAPWLAALGAIAAIATKCTITVVRKE